jgi:hypothetical protein
MPTFRYDKLTATSYRVSDAHTGEAYGVVTQGSDAGLWYGRLNSETSTHIGAHATRDDAARALYAARHAHGFEAGAL